ncbi:hypothetical protein RRG08_004890 [Elysia crispata]|uniref:Uncharacterized protein n=1 Tax=Elysia crispata TaxID=231223 RepID=A0AAE0ZHX1_9GAST|nr:hypothetical protein RRG08_004890 [Elysia crispata]
MLWRICSLCRAFSSPPTPGRIQDPQDPHPCYGGYALCVELSVHLRPQAVYRIHSIHIHVMEDMLSV